MPLAAHRLSTDVTLRVDLPYLLHRPSGTPPASGWPLVVFLHGSGERGDDVALLKRQGLPRRIEEGFDLPALLLAPQCPSDGTWAHQLPALTALIDRVTASETVDSARITLTGLSLGGAGVCDLARAQPTRFAALAPICGPWVWYYATPATARIPTWAFHGDADEVVPVADSRRLIARLHELGGAARLTEYPGVGHDAWTPAYADPELIAWLLDPPPRR
jgi:predicted peptidase